MDSNFTVRPRPPQSSMLSCVHNPASRKKWAFISQPGSPPKHKSTLNFGGGGCVVTNSIAQVGVYFADTGYGVDTVLSPQRQELREPSPPLRSLVWRCLPNVFVGLRGAPRGLWGSGGAGGRALQIVGLEACRGRLSKEASLREAL